MPNKLTFTTSINIANLRAARVLRLHRIDEDAKTMMIEVQLQGASMPYDIVYSLSIADGTCDSIQAVGSPTTILGAIASIPINVPTAFDQILAAYRAAGDGRSNVLTTMATLGLLPPGTVS